MNPLGLDKPAGETRVVVAMSGGVDSSATAGLLAEQGFDVVGVTLQLYDHGQAVARPGSCCAGPDIRDARRVAERLGIPHYVLDFEDKFRESVIDDFADTYLRGETPNPCIRCNQTVKFRDLLDTAKELGADLLATGHYARWKQGPGGPELWAGEDARRDQSYFLFATTREQLGFLRFPLGSMDKDATRAIAERLALPVAAKPDSQDICFVPDGDYAGVVAGLRPGARVPGDIVHVDGTVLGRHEGVLHYTVGQRRGLGIGGRVAADGGALYVVRLEPETARVVVGPREALLRPELVVGNVNWLGDVIPGPEGRAVAVKLRSAMAPVAARLLPGEGDTMRVVLDAPQGGVAPGQACVFYEGGRVLGGGWIRRDDVST